MFLPLLISAQKLSWQKLITHQEQTHLKNSLMLGLFLLFLLLAKHIQVGRLTFLELTLLKPSNQ